MTDTLSIYQAKSEFSRLVKRARDGEVIYIGAYGKPEVILAPVPPHRPIQIGIWADRRDPDFDYESEDVIGPDPSIMAELEAKWTRQAAEGLE
jgi:antitoxin (DNA-binding transcriptional repressor) of toxin-antitoxin stability system